MTILLVDIQLPDLDGVQALHRLRADPRTATIPMALTAQAMQGDPERFLAAGFEGYLSKPVNVRDEPGGDLTLKGFSRPISAVNVIAVREPAANVSAL